MYGCKKLYRMLALQYSSSRITEFVQTFVHVLLGEQSCYTIDCESLAFALVLSRAKLSGEEGGQHSTHQDSVQDSFRS